MPDSNKRYTYQDAGFDGFLSRSIDNLSQTNLDSPGPISRQVAFDRTQVTGALGDIQQIGRIHIDGAAGNITLNDGEVTRFLLGEDKDGF